GAAKRKGARRGAPPPSCPKKTPRELTPPPKNPNPPRHSQPPKDRHALPATREPHASLDRAALSPGEQLSSLSCSSSRGVEMPRPRQWRAGLPLTPRLSP